MRLINSFQFKQMLLEDRNMLVPKTVNDPFAQAVRYGIRRALRCMEQCATIRAEPVKHGKWENVEGSSRWEQHRCSVCKKEAIFKYEYIDDYDDDMDGEWEYIGQRENGITEYLTDYCPNCGAKMGGE